MNWDIVKGDWKQFRGKVQEQWGKLTDDDMHQIEGRRDQLLGKLQSRYGYEKQRAEDELSRFEQTCTSYSQEEDFVAGGARGSKSSMEGSMGSSRESNRGSTHGSKESQGYNPQSSNGSQGRESGQEPGREQNPRNPRR